MLCLVRPHLPLLPVCFEANCSPVPPLRLQAPLQCPQQMQHTRPQSHQTTPAFALRCLLSMLALSLSPASQHPLPPAPHPAPTLTGAAQAWRRATCPWLTAASSGPLPAQPRQCRGTVPLCTPPCRGHHTPSWCHRMCCGTATCGLSPHLEGRHAWRSASNSSTTSPNKCTTSTAPAATLSHPARSAQKQRSWSPVQPGVTRTDEVGWSEPCPATAGPAHWPRCAWLRAAKRMAASAPAQGSKAWTTTIGS